MKNFNIQLFAMDYTEISIYSNDGQTLLYHEPNFEVSMWEVSDFTVTSTGLQFGATQLFTYTGNETFIGFATSINQTIPVYSIGDEVGFFDASPLYVVTSSSGIEDSNTVIIYSNDGQTQLVYAQNVQSIDVTSTGATFTYITTGSPADYTYSSTGNTFNGFATQANSSTPTYNIGDTITVSSALPVNNNVLSLYCVEITGILYKHLLKDGDKIQVDSAIRDGNGAKIDTCYEKIANKVTSISNTSTDTQYPSAKCTYDYAQEVTILTTEPTSANTSGRYKLVKLTSEPVTRYDGYIYFIVSSNSQ